MCSQEASVSVNWNMEDPYCCLLFFYMFTDMTPNKLKHLQLINASVNYKMKESYYC